MSIKKDEHGKRWVEMEIVVPGTPEQVWQAVATGPGYTACHTRTEIEERIGGTILFDLGPYGSSRGEVTIWEPLSRFGYVEREWSEGAPPVETEVMVTSRPDGKCLFRMTHALVAATDDWDASLEGFETGWPGFFEVLRLYLAHFAGSLAASFQAITSVEAPQLEVWKRLTDALGLAAANVGEERTIPEPERFSGTVERVQQSDRERYLLLRLTAPAPGVALIGTYGMGDATNASIILYLYGDDAATTADAAKEKWASWLDGLLNVHANSQSAPTKSHQ